MSPPKLVRIAAISAAVIAFASALHPYGAVKSSRARPGAAPLRVTDPAAAAAISRACVDCHSNRTEWPWYSYLPPSSWLVERDVNDGREHFNLSNWSTYDQQKKAEILAEIARVAANHEMPPRQYLLLHKHARLSNEDAQTIVSWAGKERRQIRNAPKT